MRTYLFIALGLSLGLSVFLMEDFLSVDSESSASWEMPAVRVAAGPAADRPPVNPARRVDRTSGDRWAMMPFKYLAAVAKPAATPPRLSESCRALFKTTEWPEIVDAVYTGVGGGLLLTENRILTSQG
ncbi:MAG TPA: hypothetical protein EYN66_06385 [Myxococcales bacterium]|nr:hypothetical protein [Myxococcales bacterium]